MFDYKMLVKRERPIDFLLASRRLVTTSIPAAHSLNFCSFIGKVLHANETQQPVACLSPTCTCIYVSSCHDPINVKTRTWANTAQPSAW